MEEQEHDEALTSSSSRSGNSLRKSARVASFRNLLGGGVHKSSPELRNSEGTHNSSSQDATAAAAASKVGRQQTNTKLKRSLSQRSNRSLGKKKYLAPGHTAGLATSMTTSIRKPAEYLEVNAGWCVPVVFQWPRTASEISVLFRAQGTQQWDEYSMYGDSVKGYRLLALLEPAVYHVKFWADGVYYQHPGCPLPIEFPSDFVVAFSLKPVCECIRPEEGQVKKIAHQYALKTWVRHAVKHGFDLGITERSNSTLKDLISGKRDSDTPPEEDIDTASTISDDEQHGSDPSTAQTPTQQYQHQQRRSDKSSSKGSNNTIGLVDDSSEEEDQFHSDSSYFSSTSEVTDEEVEEEEDGDGDERVRGGENSDTEYESGGEDDEAGERNENISRRARRTNAADRGVTYEGGHDDTNNEEDEKKKDSKREKMKRGPLVRLHPKTVLPINFFWPGGANSVRLLYKSYFQSKWKSRAMEPNSSSSADKSSRWSVRVSLLPGLYQTCYLIDGEHYHTSVHRRVADPQRNLSDCNIYRIDVDIKPWLEGTKKKGYLAKQSGRLKSWKQRHIVLRGHELRCFKDNKETELVDAVDLYNMEGDAEVLVPEKAGKKRPCLRLCFSNGRTDIFSSSGQEEIEDWVRHIKRSAFTHKNWRLVLSRLRPSPASYYPALPTNP